MKRILIVHRYFWPENISNLPLMLADIVDYHIKNNEEVHLCCGSSSDFISVREKRFKKKVNINSFRSDLDRNHNIFIRLINILRLLILSLRTINKYNFDILYIVSYPPFLSFLILIYKKIFNKKYNIIFYIQDNFSYRFRNQFIKFFYNYTLKKNITESLFSIVISDSMKKFIIDNDKKNILLKRKLFVLRNYSVDKVLEINNEKDIDIIYAGNHGKAQNLKYFLSSLVYLKDMNLKIEFYGEGSEKKQLEKYCQEKNIGVKFYPYLNRDKVLEKINKSKFALISLAPNMLNYAFPSKILTYLSAGSMPLFLLDSNITEISWLKRNNIALVLPSNNKKEFVTELRLAIENYFLKYQFDNTKLLKKSELTKSQYFKKLDLLYKNSSGK